MRNVFLMLFSLVTVVACNTNGTTKTADVQAYATDTATYTTLHWIDSTKDIGPVKFGETVNIDFEFENTGEHPLYVVSVEPGCGCTVADYPKKAIGKGEKGTITAAFDTNKGSEGEFRKNILVTTNTREKANILYFSGTIVKDPNEESALKKPGA